MSFFELKLTMESGWYFMEEIGRLKMIQLVPEDADHFKKSIYVQQIEQARALLGRLDRIESVCQRLELPLARCPDVQEFVEQLNNTLSEREKQEQKPRHTMLSKIAETVGAREGSINEIYKNFSDLQLTKERMGERFGVLRSLKRVLPPNVAYKNIETNDVEARVERFGFFYLCGTIAARDAFRLQRAVFRISRENVLLRLLDVEREEKFGAGDPLEPRKIYFLIFQSGPAMVLRQKVLDLLKTFDARPQTLPHSYDKIEEALQQIEAEFDQLVALQEQSRERLIQSLRFFTEPDGFSRVSPLEEFRMIIAKELSIYAELSKFRVENKIMSARFWVATENVPALQNEVARIKRENEQVRADIFEELREELRTKPPTHFKLTDLTAPFQLIVDTYGVPRYQEANPGLFTVVTFPYLFGFMFGDIGHGGLLWLVGFLLIYLYEPLKSRGLHALVEQRYLLFSMGFFACFCGLVYNDFMSIPWKLFGSCYKRHGHEFAREEPDCTYPLGFDPVWFMSTEEVGFVNSFKMKLSIIAGVVHMMLGIFMKALNSWHFRNWVDLVFEFVPQFVFMAVTFGYMCAAIVIKWVQDWGDGSRAPSIISIFINMGYAEEGAVLWGDDQGEQQTRFQQSLFFIAFICFWVMLLPKPIILALKARFAHRPAADSQPQKTVAPRPLGSLSEPLVGEMEALEERPILHPAHEEEHDISEIFVHQMIEVIEFVLGSVSNTASYLRLWALSLAHGQLAKVFLDMTVLNQLKAGSPVAAVVGFPVFLCCTLFVLMIMDLMECFLHTLRLHWVEFQNKFFKGDGYKFDPFDIAACIQTKMAEAKADSGKGEV